MIPNVDFSLAGCMSQSDVSARKEMLDHITKGVRGLHGGGVLNPYRLWKLSPQPALRRSHWKAQLHAAHKKAIARRASIHRAPAVGLVIPFPVIFVGALYRSVV